MTNRLDNTNCPELDPLISVLDIANLKDDLNDANTVLDEDFVMWHNGEKVGAVVLDAEARLAFMLLNPVY